MRICQDKSAEVKAQYLLVARNLNRGSRPEKVGCGNHSIPMNEIQPTLMTEQQCLIEQSLER